MDKKEVEIALKNIIRKMKDLEDYQILDSSDLLGECKFDSMELIDFLNCVEEKLGIKFTDSREGIPNLEFSNIIELVMKLKNKEQPTTNKLEDFIEYTHKSMKNTHKFNKSDKSNNLNVVSKEYLKGDPYHCIATQYEVEHRNGNLIEKNIIGSGRCLRILHSEWDAIIKLKIEFDYRKKWYQIHPKDSKLTFHSTHYIGNRIFKAQDVIKEINNILSINTRCVTNYKLDNYIKKITEFNPKWIQGTPAVLYILSHYVLENNIHFPKIKYIELTGEVLTKEVRAIISQAFPEAQIANQYSCLEIGMIAYECPNHHMHMIDENVFVELEKNGTLHRSEEEGIVVLTSLNNYTTPLLRYKLGDWAKIRYLTNCECGCSSPELKLISAMNSGFLRMRDGEILSADTLRYSIEQVNKEFNYPITQFQIIQMKECEVYIYLVLLPKFKRWKSAIKDCFIKFANENLGEDMEWQIVFINQLVDGEYTGSFSYFRNCINAGGE